MSNGSRGSEHKTQFPRGIQKRDIWNGQNEKFTWTAIAFGVSGTVALVWSLALKIVQAIYR